MSDVASLITALAGLVVAVGVALPAVGSFIVSLRNSRSLAVVEEKVRVIDAKADVLHELTNSLSEKRTEAVRVGAQALGELKGAKDAAELKSKGPT